MSTTLPLSPRSRATARELARPTARVEVRLRPAATAAVFLGAGQSLEEIAVPGVSLGAHEALVAIELSTVCAIDLQVLDGTRPCVVPAVLGHESVGRVIGVGQQGVRDVAGRPVAIGDRVVWAAHRHGQQRLWAHHELVGGFASHAHLPEGTPLVRAPEGLPAAALAPAACATTTAWLATNATGLDLDGLAVRVHGAGLTGLAVTAMAHARGARVEVLDPDPARRALAQRFGALEDGAAPQAPTLMITTSNPASGEAVVRMAGHSASPLVVAARGDLTGHALAAAVDFLAGPGAAYPFADVVSAVQPLTHLEHALQAAKQPGAPHRIAVAAR